VSASSSPREPTARGKKNRKGEGHEGDAVPLAGRQDPYPAAIDQIEAILDGGDRRDMLCALQHFGRGAGQPDVADLAFVAQFDEGTERFFERHLLSRRAYRPVPESRDEGSCLRTLAAAVISMATRRNPAGVVN
jgi:hypothetical protein